MADKKSREGRVYVCVDCSNMEVFNDNIFDGRSCKKCGGHSSFAGYGGIDLATGQDLSVEMDIAGTIKGLKAIQRETKKTIADLKELEAQQSKTRDVLVTMDGKTIGNLLSQYLTKHCIKCGSINHTESKLYADNNKDNPLRHIKACDKCGYTEALPTYLEGSE